MLLQCSRQSTAIEVFGDQRKIGRLDSELHGQVERGRRLAAARYGDQDDIGLFQIEVGDAVVVGQRVVDRLDALLVIGTVGRAVRAPDGMA